MYFFIDGYNLLFSSLEMQKSLRLGREKLVRWLQQEFKRSNLEGSIVFDGAHKRDEESGLSYQSPLDIAYTPKGQSADAFIVEKLSLLKNCKTTIVVTNDQGLRRHAQALGAKTESNEKFLATLFKRSQKNKAEPKVPKESDFQINRLLQIFEERLKKESDDDDLTF